MLITRLRTFITACARSCHTCQLIGVKFASGDRKYTQHDPPSEQHKLQRSQIMKSSSIETYSEAYGKAIGYCEELASFFAKFLLCRFVQQVLFDSFSDFAHFSRELCHDVTFWR